MNADAHRRTAGISTLEIMLALVLLVLLGGLGFFFISTRGHGPDEQAPDLLAEQAQGRSHGVVDDLGRGPRDGGADDAGDLGRPESWNGEGEPGASSASSLQTTPAYRVTARTSGVEIGQELRDYFDHALADDGRPDWGSFMSLVGGLDPEQLPEAWVLLQEQPWSSEKQETMEAFMVHWAQQDSEAALEFARSLTSSRQRHLAYSTALKTWATADPEGAVEWYEERVANGDGAPGRAFFAGLHAVRPELALQMVWDMEDLGRSAEMLRSIYLPRDGDRESGASSVKALFDVEEDPERRAVLARIVADVWAKEDPMRAVAWAQELEDEADTQHGIYMAAARSWGRREPEATMGWLQENEIENIESGVIHQITRSWSHDDRTSLGQWIEETPASPLKDSVISTEVQHRRYRDPASALALAESLSNPDARYKAMAGVADHWMRRDKNAAASAVLASSMPPDLKRKYAMKVIPKNVQKKRK